MVPGVVSPREADVGEWGAGRCWVLVMTLCMGGPVSWARLIPGSNFGLVILYGADGDRGKEAGAGSRAPECSPIRVMAGGVEPEIAGVCRVNSGPGMDASGAPGRDSKGDAPHVS